MIIYQDRAFKITQSKFTHVIKIFHKNQITDRWILKAKEYRLKGILPARYRKEYIIHALHMLEDLNEGTVVEFRASRKIDVNLMTDLKEEFSKLDNE